MAHARAGGRRGSCCSPAARWPACTRTSSGSTSLGAGDALAQRVWCTRASRAAAPVLAAGLFAFANLYAVRRVVVVARPPAADRQPRDRRGGAGRVTSCSLAALGRRVLGWLLALPRRGLAVDRARARRASPSARPTRTSSAISAFFVYWLPFESALCTWAFVTIVADHGARGRSSTRSRRACGGQRGRSTSLAPRAAALRRCSSAVLLALVAWSFRLDEFRPLFARERPRRRVLLRRPPCGDDVEQLARGARPRRRRRAARLRLARPDARRLRRARGALRGRRRDARPLAAPRAPGRQPGGRGDARGAVLSSCARSTRGARSRWTASSPVIRRSPSARRAPPDSPSRRGTRRCSSAPPRAAPAATPWASDGGRATVCSSPMSRCASRRRRAIRLGGLDRGPRRSPRARAPEDSRRVAGRGGLRLPDRRPARLSRRAGGAARDRRHERHDPRARAHDPGRAASPSAGAISASALIGAELPGPRPVAIAVRDVRRPRRDARPLLRAGERGDAAARSATRSTGWSTSTPRAPTYPLSRRDTLGDNEYSYVHHAATAIVNAPDGEGRAPPRSAARPGRRELGAHLPATLRRGDGARPGARERAACRRATARGSRRACSRATAGAARSRRMATSRRASSTPSPRRCAMRLGALPGSRAVAWSVPLVDANEHVTGVVVGARRREPAHVLRSRSRGRGALVDDHRAAQDARSTAGSRRATGTRARARRACARCRWRAGSLFAQSTFGRRRRGAAVVAPRRRCSRATRS